MSDDQDLTNAPWRKASRSVGQGACVEVANLDGQVAVRDSKAPMDPALVVSSAMWRQFATRAKNGAFDRS